MSWGQGEGAPGEDRRRAKFHAARKGACAYNEEDYSTSAKENYRGHGANAREEEHCHPITRTIATIIPEERGWSSVATDDVFARRSAYTRAQAARARLPPVRRKPIRVACKRKRVPTSVEQHRLRSTATPAVYAFRRRRRCELLREADDDEHQKPVVDNAYEHDDAPVREISFTPEKNDDDRTVEGATDDRCNRYERYDDEDSSLGGVDSNVGRIAERQDANNYTIYIAEAANPSLMGIAERHPAHRISDENSAGRMSQSFAVTLVPISTMETIPTKTTRDEATAQTSRGRRAATRNSAGTSVTSPSLDPYIVVVANVVSFEGHGFGERRQKRSDIGLWFGRHFRQSSRTRRQERLTIIGKLLSKYEYVPDEVCAQQRPRASE